MSRHNLAEGKPKDDGGIVIDFDKSSSTRNELLPEPDLRKTSVVSTTGYQSSNEFIKSSDDQDKMVPVLTKELLWNMNQFQRKNRKGTIDVWWLYDDGGLTMLIPYLLSTRSQYDSIILRVFTLANRKDELDREKRNMAALLSKFRIDFQDVTVVPDIIKPPKPETVKEFESLISKFRSDESQADSPECCIRESELKAMKDKNNRHIRLRELLLEHSSEASLIVMTLTIPRKGICSAPLFLSWLEMLTKDMPPFLLVRGNQSSVLTFYS
jgi:solute carrier family 12 sodium/potassium/chloride transporter 2